MSISAGWFAICCIVHKLLYLWVEAKWCCRAFPLSQIEDSNLVEKVAQQMPIQEIATEKFQGPHLGIRSSANLMNKIFEKKSCSLNIPGIIAFFWWISGNTTPSNAQYSNSYLKVVCEFWNKKRKGKPNCFLTLLLKTNSYSLFSPKRDFLIPYLS